MYRRALEIRRRALGKLALWNWARIVGPSLQSRDGMEGHVGKMVGPWICAVAGF